MLEMPYVRVLQCVIHQPSVASEHMKCAAEELRFNFKFFFFFFFFAAPHGTWDISSMNRARTRAHYIESVAS